MMAALIAVMTLTLAPAHAMEPQWQIRGADKMGVVAIKHDAWQFKIDFKVYPPNFVALELPGTMSATGGVRRYHQTINCGQGPVWDKRPRFDGTLQIDYLTQKTGPRTVTLTFTTTCDKTMMFSNPSGQQSKGTPSFWVGPVFNATDPLFAGGTCTYETADGKTGEFKLADRGSLPKVKSAYFQTVSGEAVRLVCNPPIFVHRDMGQVRLWTDSEALAPGTPFTQTIEVELPGEFSFQPDNAWVKTDDWFELKFDNDFSKPGVIDMHSWQDVPAGKHGWLQEKGNAYVFEDGTPIKIWGDVACIWNDDQAKLDRHADAMSKYGINMVRCVTMSEKATGWSHFYPLSDPQDSLTLDAKNLDRYDYALAKFKEHGIYAYISPFYYHRLMPADKARMINAAEMEAMQLKDGFLKDTTYQLSVLCPDLQDLFIQWHLNLLNHVNPYTKLRYADDPAMAIWELNNEDNIFLSLLQMEERFKKAPTYNKKVYERFAKLMLEKYGSQEAFAKAWGATLRTGESLTDATVNPWPKWFDGNTTSPRLADQMYFFYRQQSDYYHAWAKAVRATGYKGVLSAGCWQAANWIGHQYNVLTDAEIGTISRHNYSVASLKKPGVGLMSAGFQALLDRTFIMSEWHGMYRVGQHTDVPLIAVYGMGLQGWDGSNRMSWGGDGPGLLPYSKTHINCSTNSFGVLAQYAAMSRMTRRMDVTEGAVVGNRRVSIPGLKHGDVGFKETFSLLGGANYKEFDCAIPNAAMAAGRVVLEFVDGPVEQPIIDKSGPYIDANTGVICSTTGELLWDGSGEGFFTVNTAGSKAIVGYVGGRNFELGEVKLRTDNPYAQIYVTALGKDEHIAHAKGLLITTLARVVDTGIRFDEYAFEPAVGPGPDYKNGPVLIEPVTATFELTGHQNAKVFALDHEGRKPADAKPLPVEKTKDGIRFTLDGAKTKAVYYSVELH